MVNRSVLLNSQLSSNDCFALYARCYEARCQLVVAATASHPILVLWLCLFRPHDRQPFSTRLADVFGEREGVDGQAIAYRCAVPSTTLAAARVTLPTPSAAQRSERRPVEPGTVELARTSICKVERSTACKRPEPLLSATADIRQPNLSGSNQSQAGTRVRAANVSRWPGRANAKFKLVAENRSSKAAQQGKF